MLTSLCFLLALLFGGKVKVNPAHPKQIGSIDPNCRVSDVIRGDVIYFLRTQTLRLFRYVVIQVSEPLLCSSLKQMSFL